VTTFADSSALVKLYVAEPGREKVRQLAEPLVISALASVEVAGAMWRKQRLGELDPADAALLVRAFEADRAGTAGDSRFITVAVAQDILRHAARLVAVHPLRAYDSVQLASALATQRALAEPLSFAAVDRTLNAAAAAEGLQLAALD